MALTDYTTFDEVRSALGVDGDELPDSTLGLPRFLTEVEIGLEEVGATVITQYTTIAAKAVGSRTEAERMIYDRTRLCATYIAAAACLSGLPLFAVKSETDAKSGYSRFSGDVVEQVASAIAESLGRYRVALQNAVSKLESGSAVTKGIRPFMFIASPASDPVTGS